MAKKAAKKKSATRGSDTSLAQLFARKPVRYGLGVAAGAILVGTVAVAVSAWPPEPEHRAGQPDAAVISVTRAAPAPSVPPVVLPREEPRQMEPEQDPAPQPPRDAKLPPPERPSLPPAPSGVPPWQKFAVAEPAAQGPRVAVVIDDAGLDHARTARIIALPGPLTISFLTYGDGLAPQVRAARAAGHELMVHVAMEATRRTIDPGPDVLLRDIEPDELLARLTRVLSRFEGYVGINNHMGSLFTADRPSMEIVLREVKRRGLLFLDSRTSGDSVGGEVSRALGLPYAERDVFLDNEPTTAAVGKQLIELERVARARGAAIAIGHPRDGTVEALAQWIPDAKKRGFVFVPVSMIVRDNAPRWQLSQRP